MWYINRGGITIGPFPAAELKRMATTGQLHPMEWVRQDSATEWIEAHRIQGLFPNAGAPAEHVFFDENGIRVTTVRFVVPNQTFAMSGITSCKFFVKQGQWMVNWPLVLLPPVSVGVVLWGLGVLFGMDGFMGGLVFFVTFSAFLVVALKVFGKSLPFWYRTPDIYCVTLGTAGGEVRALGNHDERFIRRIVRAVTDAMIARG